MMRFLYFSLNRSVTWSLTLYLTHINVQYERKRRKAIKLFIDSSRRNFRLLSLNWTLWHKAQHNEFKPRGAHQLHDSRRPSVCWHPAEDKICRINTAHEHHSGRRVEVVSGSDCSKRTSTSDDFNCQTNGSMLSLRLEAGGHTTRLCLFHLLSSVSADMTWECYRSSHPRDESSKSNDKSLWPPCRTTHHTEAFTVRSIVGSFLNERSDEQRSTDVWRRPAFLETSASRLNDYCVSALCRTAGAPSCCKQS